VSPDEKNLTVVELFLLRVLSDGKSAALRVTDELRALTGLPLRDTEVEKTIERLLKRGLAKHPSSRGQPSGIDPSAFDDNGKLVKRVRASAPPFGVEVEITDAGREVLREIKSLLKTSEETRKDLDDLRDFLDDE